MKESQRHNIITTATINSYNNDTGFHGKITLNKPVESINNCLNVKNFQKKYRATTMEPYKFGLKFKLGLWFY